MACLGRFYSKKQRVKRGRAANLFAGAGLYSGQVVAFCRDKQGRGHAGGDRAGKRRQNPAIIPFSLAGGNCRFYGIIKL